MAVSAIESARQTGIFPVLVMALENEIACALAREDSQAALRAAEEMVQIIEPGKLHDLMRARALINHARCLVGTGDLAGAESKLAVSWDLLQRPAAFRNMPGSVAALANWWEAKSHAFELHGEIAQAREAIAQSIDYRRQNDSPYTVVLLVRALELSAGLSRRSGDLAGAEKALAEANSLREDLRLPAKG